jgi:RHS repeat-associated protein
LDPYDANGNLTEIEEATGATSGYVYGENLISRSTNGTPHYYLFDGMGSTRSLTDMTGTVTDTYSYDAYGNLLDKTGTTINPYLYRGEQFDEDLSSYYLRARYYQPGIGRFLTTDPVEGFPTEPLSQHRYVYGNCNPVNYIDPSGKLSYVEQALVVATILSGTVAAISTTGALDGVYEKYGDWLPDAAVFGFSGTPNIGGLIQKYLDWADIGGDLWHYPIRGSHTIGASGGVSLGIEFLFSISSAQIGAFWYWGPQVEFTRGTSSYGSFSLYKAWVWNLWNTDDYSGPFISMSIGRFMAFCDGKRYLKGPYGIGYNILGKSSFFSLSHTSYRYALGTKPFNYDDEWEIGPKLWVAQAAFALIHLLLSPKDGGAVPVLVFSIESSMTYITCRAKGIWNRSRNIKIKAGQNDLPNILYRQEDDRPQWWQSGPKTWHLSFI